jgi:hypothetical protein
MSSIRNSRPEGLGRSGYYNGRLGDQVSVLIILSATRRLITYLYSVVVLTQSPFSFWDFEFSKNLPCAKSLSPPDVHSTIQIGHLAGLAN